MPQELSLPVPALLSLEERVRLSAGQRLETPCGEGVLVWHAWGERRPGVAPLVLLHGGSGSWTHWVRNILPQVDAGRWVLAADLPGFGDSAAPVRGTDADAMIEPLATGLRQLLPGEPVDLVGFSFGGMTAGMLVAAFPDIAQRLVLVGAPAMGVTPGTQFELKAWRHLKSPQEQMDVHRHNLGVLMLHDHGLIEGLALEVHLANMERDRLTRRRLSRTDILAQSLPQVNCPVHAIYGEHDVLYRGYLSQLKTCFEQTAPDFQGLQLIEGAGHWVQFETPDAFNAALAKTLAPVREGA